MAIGQTESFYTPKQTNTQNITIITLYKTVNNQKW